MSKNHTTPPSTFNRIFSSRHKSATAQVISRSNIPLNLGHSKRHHREEHIQGFLKNNHITQYAYATGVRAQRVCDVHSAMETYLRAQTQAVLELRRKVREFEALTDKLEAWCVNAF
jgi:hypothetical protein